MTNQQNFENTLAYLYKVDSIENMMDASYTTWSKNMFYRVCMCSMEELKETYPSAYENKFLLTLRDVHQKKETA